MKQVSLAIILALLLGAISCSKDDSMDTDGSPSDFYGTYEVYFYEDDLYPVEDEIISPVSMMNGVGSDFNNATYTFDSEGLMSVNGSFTIIYNDNPYLNETFILDSNYPVPYYYNDADNTLSIGEGEGEAIISFSDNTEITLTYENLYLNDEGGGSYYKQTWKMRR